MHIAVAIATKDRPSLLQQSLESVMRQQTPPNTIVVTDDGVRHGETHEVCRQFGSVHVVASGGRGIAAARNLALDAASGSDVIVVQDDDDIMLPNRIADHLTAFSQGVDVSFGGWANVHSAAGGSGQIAFVPGNPKLSIASLLLGSANIAHGAAAYSAKLLARHRYDDALSVGCDMDLHARLLSHGARFSHTGSYVLARRLHPESMTQTQSGIQRAVKAKLLERHLPAGAILPLSEIEGSLRLDRKDVTQAIQIITGCSGPAVIGYGVKTLAEAAIHLTSGKMFARLVPPAEPGFGQAILPFPSDREQTVEFAATVAGRPGPTPTATPTATADQSVETFAQTFGLAKDGSRIIVDLSQIGQDRLHELQSRLALISPSWRFTAYHPVIARRLESPMTLAIASNRFGQQIEARHALLAARDAVNGLSTARNGGAGVCCLVRQDGMLYFMETP